MSLLLIVDKTSIFPYLYSLVIYLCVDKFICHNKSSIIHFHFYVIIAIILFVAHKLIIPEYLGLTGPEGGIGTDDCRYYAQLLDGNVPYKIIFTIDILRPYTRFLSVLYPFPIYTPLNIIVVNVLGVTFLPYIVRLFSYELFHEKRLSQRAELLTLTCPFTCYYGCILMREMWVVTAVFLSLLFFCRKNYACLVFPLLFVAFIRLGSVIFLVLGVFCIWQMRVRQRSKNSISSDFKILGVVGIIILLFIVVYPMIIELSDGRLEAGLIRASFVQDVLDSNSLITKLFNLPFPINVALLTVFFFFLPFLSFDLYTLGVFNVGVLLNNLITPFYFFFLWPPILCCLFESCKYNNNERKSIVLMAVLFAVALATVSLQARHKDIMMPLLCILASYGMSIPKSQRPVIAYIGGVVIFIGQLVFSII